MRNSLFTHCVLEGLRDKAKREDGTVWMNDLFSFVHRQIEKYDLQTPFQNTLGRDFIITNPKP
jgi:hypothetical protein